MAITSDGSGTISYTPPRNKQRSDATGTVVDDEFAIVDNTNVLKQIQFRVNPTTTAKGVLTVECDVGADQTINLTNINTSYAFGIIQPPSGTSPTADAQADTLNLTSSDSSVTITGTAATDTLDFTSPMTTQGDTLYRGASTVTRLPVGSVGQMLEVTSSGVPSWGDGLNDIFYNLRIVEDWISGSSSGLAGWALSNSGTGAGATAGDPAAIQTTNVQGILRIQSGTDTTGRADISLGNTPILLGGGVVTCHSRMYLSNLSDATDTYTIRLGLGDTSNGDHVDGVYFEYSHGTNSGNWVGKTASNSSRTSVNSSVPVTTGAWTCLSFVVNAAATSVEFFVNNVSIGTSTTNIPTAAGRTCGPHMHIIKSAGTNGRELDVDFFVLNQRFTNARLP